MKNCRTTIIQLEEETNSINIKRSVTQDDVISLKLFILAIEEVIFFELLRFLIKAHGKNVDDFKFSDDVVLIVQV